MPAVAISRIGWKRFPSHFAIGSEPLVAMRGIILLCLGLVDAYWFDQQYCGGWSSCRPAICELAPLQMLVGLIPLLGFTWWFEALRRKSASRSSHFIAAP